MAEDLDELTRGLRRMWSTASLTSKLGAKAGSTGALETACADYGTPLLVMSSTMRDS